MKVSKVAVLVMPGTVSTTMSVFLDTFSFAKHLAHQQADVDGKGWKVRLVAQSLKPFSLRPGVIVEPQADLDWASEADLIVIPSVGLDVTSRLDSFRPLGPWLRQQHQRGALLASACTGAFVLAEAGVLNGRRATSHWNYTEAFRKLYPEVELLPERLITEDTGVYCSGGTNACFDLALYLISLFLGPNISHRCADALVIPRSKHTHSASAAPVAQVRHTDEEIRLAQEFIEKNLFRSITVDQIASAAGLSGSTLKRRFRQATQESPVAYVQRLRVEAAKHRLLQTNDSIETIALSVGYENVAFFRKLFRRHVGVSPKVHRQRMRSQSRSPLN